MELSGLREVVFSQETTMDENISGIFMQRKILILRYDFILNFENEGGMLEML